MSINGKIVGVRAPTDDEVRFFAALYPNRRLSYFRQQITLGSARGTTNEVPVFREVHRDTSKYMPHQGIQEQARRMARRIRS